MKRWLAIVIAIILVSAFVGCGKSEMVKKTEEAIDSIGVVTLESGEIIMSAEKYYDSLTDKEKEQVSNRSKLIDAKVEYERLVIERQEKEEQMVIEQQEKEEQIDQFIDNIETSFSASFDVIGAIASLNNIKRDCNERQLRRINELLDEYEGMCYEGTHFLTLGSVITLDDNATYSKDTGYLTYRTDKDSYNGRLGVIDDLSKTINGTYGLPTEVIGQGYFYRYISSGNSFHEPLTTLYSNYLERCSQKKVECAKVNPTWGMPEKDGRIRHNYGYYYEDDLGNRLYYQAQFFGDGCEFQIFIG